MSSQALLRRASQPSLFSWLGSEGRRCSAKRRPLGEWICKLTTLPDAVNVASAQDVMIALRMVDSAGLTAGDPAGRRQFGPGGGFLTKTIGLLILAMGSMLPSPMQTVHFESEDHQTRLVGLSVLASHRPSRTRVRRADFA